MNADGKKVGIPTQADIKYSHHDNVAGTTVLPASMVMPTGVDTMTPIDGVYTPATGTTATTLDTWEETKYIIYVDAASDPHGSSPYLEVSNNQPIFEFSDMTYYVDPSDPSSVNIRLTCPITYTLEP